MTSIAFDAGHITRARNPLTPRACNSGRDLQMPVALHCHCCFAVEPPRSEGLVETAGVSM